MQRIRIEIKNWSDYQAKARTDRKWKWIQVHRALLTDFHFRELSPADRWNLIGLWLLADPKTGVVDMEEKEVLFMLCSKSLVLENLDHFIDVLAAEPQQTAAECGEPRRNVSVEREREIEVEKSIETRSAKDGSSVASRRDGFIRFWELYPVGRKHDRNGNRDRFMRKTREGCATPDEIVDGLILWIASHDWTKDSGAFIPGPSVFLNQNRWESAPADHNISQSTGRPEGSAL